MRQKFLLQYPITAVLVKFDSPFAKLALTRLKRNGRGKWINFPLPRILFFKPDGSFLKDIINTDGNPKFKLVLLFMKQHPIYI